jgi:proline iminopeptidase
VGRRGAVLVNDVELYVDDRGDPTAPPLLYIHGGPGQGCWDFMASQGDRLGTRVRIIGVDQRGVLRSGDIPPEKAVDVDVLIADFEALRERLGIRSWAILGHSAGGNYALRYATRHPDTVSAVIFDCPCWDCDLTDRYRLPVAATRLADRGKRDAAAAALRIAQQPDRITAKDRTWLLMQELGDAYLELLFSRTDSVRAYESLVASSGFADEVWARGLSHLPLMSALYESEIHRLAGLAVPSLLIHGRDDLVVPPDVVETYRRTVPDSSVHTFLESGHFGYHEEPDAYADVLARFVHQHAR